MARKGNENKGNKENKIIGTNSCILGGKIEHWFSAKKEKAPDMIVLKIPYGEYGTNVSMYLWHNNDTLFDYIIENDIDEGSVVICECEVVCSKKVDYKPQFYVKTMELLSEKGGK